MGMTRGQFSVSSKIEVGIIDYLFSIKKYYLVIRNIEIPEFVKRNCSYVSL
jgi:hypothetical protein